MWEITKNLIITDSGLWGFCDIILHAERLCFGLFALSNVQLEHNISEAGSASVLRWWGSGNAPCLVGLGIEVTWIRQAKSYKTKC